METSSSSDSPSVTKPRIPRTALDRLAACKHDGAKINMVCFSDDQEPEFLDDFEGMTTGQVREVLGSLEANAVLFIVEHVDKPFILLLQEFYSKLHGGKELSLQFLEEQLDATPWYDHNFTDITAYMPKLHSKTADQHYANFPVIVTRSFKQRGCLPLDSMCLKAKEGTSRPDLKAVKMNAFGPGKEKECDTPPVAMIRHHFTAWCDSEHGKPWRIVVILLDPPFQLAKEQGYPELTSLRDIELCPNISCPDQQNAIRHSYRTELIHHLREHANFQRGAPPHPMLTLRNMFQIVASEWMATTAFFTRDLDRIELAMEGGRLRGADGVHRLDDISDRLALVRRRIKGYDTIIEQQRATIESCGRIGWDANVSEELVCQALADVQSDYRCVREIIKELVQRTDQDLAFAASFTSLQHGKMGIVAAERAATQNQMLMNLAFVATFFLPVGTVAAILNMTGEFAPGGDRFGMFWAICAPITVFLTLVLVVILLWQPHLSGWLARARRSLNRYTPDVEQGHS